MEDVEEAGISDNMAEQEGPPHDNYVNFDIAQTVLGASAGKHPVARGEFSITVMSQLI